MADTKKIKDMVKEKYGSIAADPEDQCGCSCCSSDQSVDYALVGDEYQNLEGYVPEADLGLGCGLPTQYAGIAEGNTVVDLGAGAGNDVFIARRIVGDKGRVIGIDMTEEMIEKAKKNNEKLGFSNVEFRLGEIENLPVKNDSADVVVSNCVINLVPDKRKVFSEIYRILKPNGHFCISDIVLQGDLPESLKKSAELYAGCIAGALQENDYLEIIKETGFSKLEVKTSKRIDIPEVVLNTYLDEDQVAAFQESNVGIFSITVVGYKK